MFYNKIIAVQAGILVNAEVDKWRSFGDDRIHGMASLWDSYNRADNADARRDISVHMREIFQNIINDLSALNKFGTHDDRHQRKMVDNGEVPVFIYANKQHYLRLREFIQNPGKVMDNFLNETVNKRDIVWVLSALKNPGVSDWVNFTDLSVGGTADGNVRLDTWTQSDYKEKAKIQFANAIYWASIDDGRKQKLIDNQSTLLRDAATQFGVNVDSLDKLIAWATENHK